MRKVARDEERPVVVSAYYGNRVDQYGNSILIGRVDPEADVHIIYCQKGEAPVVYESETAAREAGVPDENDGDELEDEWVFKALPLIGCDAYDEPKSFSFTDYPLLSAVRPRHHSFCNWYAAKEHLRAIDMGADSLRDIEDDVDDPSSLLAPAQLEVLCNEYLRLEEAYDEYTQTLPVGRTMRDVDIVGQYDGGTLFAQVTQATGSDLEEKAEKLAAYADENTVCILFGPSGEVTEIDVEGYEILQEPNPTALSATEIAYEPVSKVVSTVDTERADLLETMYELPDPAQ
ncbi:hypothetical protein CHINAEXTREME_20895 (plasmid) [Halobiforma lacisalsi AJ5]|uniref:Uncharacterized protein n=1 Tax=Natronobacterium lacisalsi AJ5 TaxID=358396 RepID=M0LA87_NATLA|nr:hypothetical protein [Halobiforma lacisalsi]APX00263.1 hypothetical protein CHINAEXTREME_20895 [Halobiforma lacisalsi AJ5]EMA29998.1 hypothetical protein C445_16869 [Halobiforma lacisalsi AJ5]